MSSTGNTLVLITRLIGSITLIREHAGRKKFESMFDP